MGYLISKLELVKKKQYLDMTRLIKDKILKYAIRLMMYNERMWVVDLTFTAC